jgi:hypothetical protein
MTATTVRLAPAVCSTMADRTHNFQLRLSFLQQVKSSRIMPDIPPPRLEID